MNSRFSLGLLPLLALIALAPHAASSAATLSEVPIHFSGGYLWLKVSAAGAAKPLQFILDSGAASSILNLNTARRLGLQLGDPQAVDGVHARSTAYPVDDFRAQSAGVALPRSLLALDFETLGIVCDRPIDGLLGADFFRGHVVQIDYAAGKLRLLDRAEPGAGAEVLRIKGRNDCFCVPLRIAGRSRQWMRVDTGCNSTLEWFAGRSSFARAGETSIGLAGGSVPYAETEVEIGNTRLNGVKTGIHEREIFPGEAGLLGNALLARFTVTIDARKKRLILEPAQ